MLLSEFSTLKDVVVYFLLCYFYHPWACWTTVTCPCLFDPCTHHFLVVRQAAVDSGDPGGSCVWNPSWAWGSGPIHHSVNCLRPPSVHCFLPSRPTLFVSYKHFMAFLLHLSDPICFLSSRNFSNNVGPLVVIVLIFWHGFWYNS